MNFHRLFCRTCCEMRQAVKEYERRQAAKRLERLVILTEMTVGQAKLREELNRFMTADPFSLPSRTQFSVRSSPPTPGLSTKRSPSWIVRVLGILWPFPGQERGG